MRSGRRLASAASVPFRPIPLYAPTGGTVPLNFSRGIAWRASAETDGEIATSYRASAFHGESLKGGRSPYATRFTQLQGLIGK